ERVITTNDGHTSAPFFFDKRNPRGCRGRFPRSHRRPQRKTAKGRVKTPTFSRLILQINRSAIASNACVPTYAGRGEVLVAPGRGARARSAGPRPGLLERRPRRPPWREDAPCGGPSGGASCRALSSPRGPGDR